MSPSGWSPSGTGLRGSTCPLLEQGAATYFTYRESSRVFEDIAVWDSEEVSITGHGEPERAQALWVTDGLLGILRVQPLLGRLFTKEDDAPGSPSAGDLELTDTGSVGSAAHQM